jgi:hypothetical protein
MNIIALPGERREESRAYLAHGWWHITSQEEPKGEAG